MWTDPKHVAVWWGPKVFTNPVCEMDVRPGGKFRIVMRAPDGAEYPYTGIYLEVVPPERIVYTDDLSEVGEDWHSLLNSFRGSVEAPPMKSFVTVTFEDLGEKTRLTVLTRFASNTDRDAMLQMQMAEGWTESLETFASLLS